MYGLLLESLASYVKERYGEDKWEEIRRSAGVDQTSFSTHQVYPENLIPRLSCKAVQMLNISEHEFMGNLGESFVDFVAQYGYDRVLSVLGRHMRDFLNGLDNLHEYLKFSYPRMRAPSFFCENESSTGLTLHYRSRRRGFVYYTMGQIKQVGKVIYNRDVEIEVVKEEVVFDMHVVTFNLKFDNRAFSAISSMDRDDQRLPLKASIFIEIFPFCILFGPDMIIRNIGNSLSHILPELIGQDISHVFDLTRPLVELKFASILKRTNNIFELVSQKSLGNMDSLDDVDDDSPQSGRKLHLKGQMLYMEEWKMIVFLGTPQMNDLDAMIRVGLYINDLSMHDFSRDLMMAGTQQSVELKLALDQEQQKSKKLEESMKKLDEEMKRTDELLYQMIPKLVADRLRKGENPIDTCQVFECVTILFSDVVTFTEICSRISPMEVVSMLNAMYSIFDRLTEQNGVYKVETIGDAYMAVGGAPVKDSLHAARTCDMALDMIDAIQGLTDPSTGQHLRIRVGVHSGAVVAGVVGLKMPRYCLFGDTVNTASRMESTSEPMKIHISQTTHELLGPDYKTADRGEIVVKGKAKITEFPPPSTDFTRKQGHMKTYWLTGKRGRSSVTSQGSRRMSVVPDDLQAAVAATLAATNRGYSPVTMDDVARRSLSGSCRNSPIPPHVAQQPGGDVHRRSIVEMEKDLQQPIDVFKSKSSLHNEVVKANATVSSAIAGNHLTVTIPPANHQTVNGSCSPRHKSDNFDLRLVCPHGKAIPSAHSPKLGGSPQLTPSSPAAHVTWSFPPRNKVVPDVAPQNGIVKDQLATIQPYEDNRSDGLLGSRIHSPHENGAAYERSAAALAMAAGFGGAGDFCCPSFGVRSHRLVKSVGGPHNGADPHSVACSIL